jgi:hypothetical protein
MESTGSPGPAPIQFLFNVAENTVIADAFIAFIAPGQRLPDKKN